MAALELETTGPIVDARPVVTLPAGSARLALDIRYLGVVAYEDAEALQRDLVIRRSAGDVSDTVLLLEHPPVVTVGRGGGLAPDQSQALAARGIRVIETSRGGKATYHGPGQLVCYPILDLRGRGGDAHAYLRELESMLITWLETYGVRAFIRPKLTGVWTALGKIAAIGVGIRNGVTFHGFAVNLDPDLSPFDLFDPCGLRSPVTTSLYRETGKRLTVSEAAASMAGPIESSFGAAGASDSLPRPR